MINHKHFAEELFYQLALARFGGLECASVTSENGLDVKVLIERFLQLDESVDSFKNDAISVQKQPVNQRNVIEAFQASKCLTDKGRFEK